MARTGGCRGEVAVLIQPFWLTLGLAVFLAVAGRAFFVRQRERAYLQDFARRHGLNFSPVDLIGLHDRYQNLRIMRTGHSRHVWNVVSGMTPAGRLSLFDYGLELGFGFRRIRQRWWVAVLELEMAREGWIAGPADEQGDRPELSAKAGPFLVRAEHAITIQKLRERGIEDLLASAPPDARFEVRGQLAAVAVPAENKPASREQLLKTVMELGSCSAK